MNNIGWGLLISSSRKPGCSRYLGFGVDSAAQFEERIMTDADIEQEISVPPGRPEAGGPTFSREAQYSDDVARHTVRPWKFIGVHSALFSSGSS